MPSAPRIHRGYASLMLLLSSCSPTAREPEIASTPPGPRQAVVAPPTVKDDTKATPKERPAATGSPAVKPSSTGESEAAAGPDTPESLLLQAEKVAKGGNLVETTRLLEKALELEPTNRTALLLLAFYLQARAMELERPQSSPLFIESARAIRKLRDTYPDLNPQEREVLGPYLYNEACTYALSKQPEKALDTLAESIDAGLSQADLLAEDDELDAIRKMPRFAELTRKIEGVARSRADEKAKELLASAKAFPFDFDLPGVDGKRYKLGDVKASVTMVDIWGTWCPPCRKEIPHLKELLAKFRDKGLAIVGINYERVSGEQIESTIRTFVEEQQIPYPCLIGDDKTREQIPDFVGYPTTLFLDRSGKVRATVVGYQSPVDLEAIVTRMLESSETPRGN